MTESERGAEEPMKLLWKFGGLAPLQLATIIIDGIAEDDLLGRAAELAYNFLLALCPLMILLLSLFGLFARHRAELLRSFLSYVSSATLRRFSIVPRDRR